MDIFAYGGIILQVLLRSSKQDHFSHVFKFEVRVDRTLDDLSKYGCSSLNISQTVNVK